MACTCGNGVESTVRMNVIHYRKQQDDEPKRGRPRLYDDEQRKQRHREAALAAYHKSGKTTRAP